MPYFFIYTSPLAMGDGKKVSQLVMLKFSQPCSALVLSQEVILHEGMQHEE